jgi:S1-C subfamily serine protease
LITFALFHKTSRAPMNFKVICVIKLSVLACSTVFARPDLTPAKSPSQVAHDAFPSVVLLATQDASGQPISLGSGFFVEKDIVATNLHVIDQAAEGYAKVVGQPAKLNIKGVVGLDAVYDLALLQLEVSAVPSLPVAPKISVKVGDTVFAIGNPRGLEGTFSQGIVSSVRELGSDRVLQITAPISPGSSGGPVLDQTGTVVEVSVATIASGQNLNFAIPSDYLAALQKKKTALRSLRTVPPLKTQRTLLGHVGGEQPRTGVVGENLRWDDDEFQTGNFSFSLHNKLSESVTDLYVVVVFHDVRGQPIDVYPIDYRGIIPAGAAKRLKGSVDTSVQRLNCPEPPWGVPKGRVEFRILNFSVGSE